MQHLIICRCCTTGLLLKPKERLAGSAPTNHEDFREKYEVLMNVWRLLATKTPGRPVLSGFTDRTWDEHWRPNLPFHKYKRRVWALGVKVMNGKCGVCVLLHGVIAQASFAHESRWPTACCVGLAMNTCLGPKTARDPNDTRRSAHHQAGTAEAKGPRSLSAERLGAGPASRAATCFLGPSQAWKMGLSASRVWKPPFFWQP